MATWLIVLLAVLGGLALGLLFSFFLLVKIMGSVFSVFEGWK